MNKMLISATQANEVRVALVREQNLYDLDVERIGFEQKKANIYKAKVSRIEQSLEAAFVDYGAERHGFLPFKEIARSFFKPELANEPFSKLSIKDALHEGQEILVQVDKEERGTKGAALTTFISLAGSYLVLMPNNPRVGGISRRIDGKERDELKELLRSLNLPEGMGLIVRTAGVGKSKSELKWDLESLTYRWEAIEKAASEKQSAPFLIYQEGDAVMRAIRDYLRQDIEEILVDDPDLFEKTKDYIEQVKPSFINKVNQYQNSTPLFSAYQIEKQIETAYQRVVRLPSGGSISIDHTEALISIDVNSSKATGGSDIETTAFNTNVEAAEEVARQLRLRDIGGLIVIDFIDMTQIKHQREVSRKLKEALEYDRARVQVGHITRFGLLEMSRQRLGSHLGESIQTTCPRCDGQGTIRSVESLVSSIIRLVEEEASKKDSAEVQVQLPIDIATFMLNEQRKSITKISEKYNTDIVILPNQYLETPKYKIKRINSNEKHKNQNASYKIVLTPELENSKITKAPTPKVEKPVVSTTRKNSKSNKIGFFKRIFNILFKKKESQKTRTKHSSRSRNYSRYSRTNAKTRGKTPTRSTGPSRKPQRRISGQKSDRYRQTRRPSERRPQHDRTLANKSTTNDTPMSNVSKAKEGIDSSSLDQKHLFSNQQTPGKSIDLNNSSEQIKAHKIEKQENTNGN